MIKIQFADMHHEFDRNNNFIIDMLKSNFEQYMVTDEPDFLFFSSQGTAHNKYTECVKIFLADKEVTPDFNYCDYAIGYDDMQFGERYFKWPHYMNYLEINRERADVGIRDDEQNALEKYIVAIINKGNTPYEKDALGLARKMSIPDLSSKELVKELLKKVKRRLGKK